MSPVSFERPALLCLVALPALALVLSWRSFRPTVDAGSAAVAAVARFWLSGTLRSLAAVAVVLALCGAARERVSVSPKKGVAVAMVFDVRESDHEPFFEDMTRPDAAKLLASSLVKRLEHTAEEALVSLVVCNSDGALLLSPYTCDFDWLDLCIAHLEGDREATGAADVASGIEVALNSLPESSPALPFVLLFCGEDASSQEGMRAVDEAKEAGAAVAAILFPQASTNEGRETDAQEAWQRASLVLQAADEGAGDQLVSFLGIADEGQVLRVAVKTQRHTLTHQLVIAAAWLFALSVFTEQLAGRGQNSLSALLVCATLVFAGCSGQATGSGAGAIAADWMIARGRESGKAGDWQRAAAYFLDAAESSKTRGDDDAYSLAVASLGTSYLMMGKDDAAFEKYQQAWEISSRQVRFLILYNEGVSCYRRGEPSVALEYFKQALILNSHSVDAKVNLELSLKAASQQSEQDAQKAAWVSGGEGEFAQLLYSIVQQQEEARWKDGAQQEH